MTFPCIAVTNYELIFANSHYLLKCSKLLDSKKFPTAETTFKVIYSHWKPYTLSLY